MWFLLTSLAALPVAAAPGPLQGNFEIHFDVSCEGTDLAEVVERLQIAGTDYQMTETSKGKGLYALLGTAKRTSRGTITKEGALQPAEFTDERSGRATARAWFDWKTQTIYMQHTGEKGSEPMPPNSQDRLSFLLAVTMMPGRMKYMKLSIFDGKGQSRHEYDLGARERVHTPAGDFDAVRITRRADPGAKDRADLWVAADFGLPVKLVHVERDGKRCEHVAKKISR
ncbi:MAG TPA: DUF3108 domain-containing protein [Burkholderiales bacterium]|nr:DUF3108 domain-containing protein [Burkholderiales bacterium]